MYFWFYFVMGMLVGGFAVGLVNFLISRILKGRKERFRHHIDSITSANQIARFPTSSNFYMVQETLQKIKVPDFQPNAAKVVCVFPMTGNTHPTLVNVHQIFRSSRQDSVIQCNGSLGIDHPPTYAEATDNPNSCSN